MTPEERRRRDRRAGAIAELLRAGHDPRRVIEAVKIADAGGNIYEAMAALRDASLTPQPGDRTGAP